MKVRFPQFLAVGVLTATGITASTLVGCAGRQPATVAGVSQLPDNWLALTSSDSRLQSLPEPTRDYLAAVRENMKVEQRGSYYKFYGRYSDALTKHMADANELANTAYLVSSKRINATLTPELVGTSETHDETNWHYAANANQDLRSLQNDWGRFWLTDKPSSLSPYPIMPTGGQP